MSQPDHDIPQWKKDLIARLRTQNKRIENHHHHQQLHTATAGPPPRAALIRTVQQPSPTSSSQPVTSEPLASCAASEKCTACPSHKSKMVQQDRNWEWTATANGTDQSDSESSEDLEYGPGIVNRLREKYLSLALREAVRPMRKAASLEHLLDEEPPRLFRPTEKPKHAPSRYQRPGGAELKRARSVEAISEAAPARPQRGSLHEDMLAGERPYLPRINRPKRVAPLLNEREKPPADLVKQQTIKFERRSKAPAGGEVAAKIATFKNIIRETKAGKKPPIKAKPVVDNKRRKEALLPSPIPDVSRIVFGSVEGERANTSLSETTPDLIMTSSPLLNPSFRIAATDSFLKEEIRNSISDDSSNCSSSPVQVKGEGLNNVDNAYTFVRPDASDFGANKNVLNTQTPPSQPLKVEINGVDVKRASSPSSKDIVVLSPVVSSKTVSNGCESQSSATTSSRPSLTIVEIEKNLKNTAKLLEQSSNRVVIKSSENDGLNKINLPKVKKPAREPENNSIVFKFTDRKDVPDYVFNEGSNRPVIIEKPKVGEGGIILLPGATIDFTDDDEELMRSLEGPPSPCNVTFINDNILIDGKSSLSSNKKKRATLRISFLANGPEVFEYPSETSLLVEIDSPNSSSNGSIGHNVPSLIGASHLATYTPKGTEEFEPGVTRSIIQNISESPETQVDSLFAADDPILFSTGTNSDILF